MLWAPFLIASADGLDVLAKWIAPLSAVITAICLFVLTRRATKSDAAQTHATQVEQLYIDSAKELISTLQAELGDRNKRLGAKESECLRLMADRQEAYAIIESLKTQQRRVMELLTQAGLPLPDDLRPGS